jgi:hypothetical protein
MRAFLFVPALTTFFESDRGHEPRLSLSGRAAVLAILRRKRAGPDQMQNGFRL